MTIKPSRTDTPMIEFFGPIFDATTPAMWLAAALAGLALGAWAVVDEIRHSRG